jgi:Zn-dependent oligopeptidase
MESMKDHMFLSFVISHLQQNKTFFLTFNEVTTLFHEFGHITRNVSQYDLSKFVWNFSLLGFCGMPSQVMETGARTGSIGIVRKTL